MNTTLSILRRKAFNSYGQMPYTIKRIASNLIRLVPPKFKFGQEYDKTLNWIRKTEFLPMEEIQAIQIEMLKSTLVNAWKNTDYYKQEMNNLGVDLNDIELDPLRVLAQLPIIDKNTVLANEDGFISFKKNQISHDYTSTGGTSGEPFYFYFDSSRSAKEWAYFSDQWGRIGFNLKSRRATFRGSKINGNWEDDWVTMERKYSSFNLTPNYLKTVWLSLNQYKPDFIYAYPSTAINLCRFMESENMQFPDSVKGILIGSENIYEGQKKYIEKISQKKVFIWYGHSEKLVLAGECEKSANYHAYPQYGYTEFITEDGLPAKPGDFCEIVGTGFLNTVMPFIRYRTGDYCVYQGDRCPACGRNYHIFSNVSGRWTQEVLYGKEGNTFSMSAINIHSKNLHHVFRFQFHQQKAGFAILKIMPKKDCGADDLISLEKEFNDKLKGSVVIKAEIVDNIPLTDRGKFKYIDQKIKRKPTSTHPLNPQDKPECNN
jgi:phenylacetate-CoA ligase